MFKFSDIIVGTKGHERLLSRLGDIAAEGKEVHYEEYVTVEGKKEPYKNIRVLPGQQDRLGPENRYIDLGETVLHKGREVKCRGHAIP